MKKQPISIIIPAYKAEDFIKECLTSISTQSYLKNFHNYEILVGVDSCSLTLLKLLPLKIKNLKVFWFDTNVGPYIVKNSLAKIAKYDTICFFDADDLMLPNYLKKNLDFFTDRQFLLTSGLNDNKHPFVAHGIIIVSKRFFLSLNGYSGWRCGADTDLINRVKLAGIEIAAVGIPTFNRRLYDNSLTHSKEYGHDTIYRQNIRQIIADKTEKDIINYQLETSPFSLINR